MTDEQQTPPSRDVRISAYVGDPAPGTLIEGLAAALGHNPDEVAFILVTPFEIVVTTDPDIFPVGVTQRHVTTHRINFEE